MKVELLCDRCKHEFLGEEWMLHSNREILCPDCYRREKESEEEV